jgi:hypothetical protein
MTLPDEMLLTKSLNVIAVQTVVSAITAKSGDGNTVTVTSLRLSGLFSQVSALDTLT